MSLQNYASERTNISTVNGPNFKKKKQNKFNTVYIPLFSFKN